MDGKGILESWLHFFGGLVRATLGICTNADGIWDLMLGLFLLALVLTAVAIPLILISLFWIISRIVRVLQNSQKPTA